MSHTDPRLAEVVRARMGTGRRLVFLTGAGISAESGIPTFRGEEGYWTRGSRVYHPQELATWATFSQDPRLVWPWYLYRSNICRRANPNEAHTALSDLETALEDRFVLVTQNVDGLHLRAGNSASRTWEIHGNIDYMRCAEECTPNLMPLPMLGEVPKGAGFDPAWEDALRCPSCQSWTRPHVLWFDESYDEARYRFQSAQEAAATAALLLVVGTAGATNLPSMMGRIAQSQGIPIVDINPELDPFGRLAQEGTGGWIQATATVGMAWIRSVILG